MRARLFSAPLEKLVAEVPLGHVADVGCGHGLLSALLAYGQPQRTVLGIDPDPRKIAHATASVGALGNAAFRVGTAESIGERAEFDAVTVADVLYLLPLSEWRRFLSSVRALLKPKGRLILKEAEADGSWRHKKTLAQELLMVHLIKKTQPSGAVGFQPRDVLVAEVNAAGLTVTSVTSVAEGYTTPHVLICAERV